MSLPDQELVRCPPPEPNNNIGPAMFLHQLTHTGGLPAQREQKGIKFRQDPELPEGVSRRSLPIVDQGTIKQGCAISAVAPMQQYPVRSSSALGRQVLSTSKSAGSITIGRKMGESTRAPPPITADTNGPAQFNLRQSMGGGATVPYQPRITQVSQAQAIKKGDDLFSLSLPKNASISDWLVEHGKGDFKVRKQSGMGKLVTHTGFHAKRKSGGRRRSKVNRHNNNGSNADVTGDEDYGGDGPKKKKSAADEINTIGDWLKKNGLPGKDNIFRAEFEHRSFDKSRGLVKPTFISVIPKYKY